MMRSPCLRIPIQLSIQVTMHIDQSQPRKQQTLYKHHVIGQTFKAKPLSNLNYIKHAQDKTRKIFFYYFIICLGPIHTICCIINQNTPVK
mgnify:CR=1 FL=1